MPPSRSRHTRASQARGSVLWSSDFVASSEAALQNAERPSLKFGAGGPQTIRPETLSRDAFCRGATTEREPRDAAEAPLARAKRDTGSRLSAGRLDRRRLAAEN